MVSRYLIGPVPAAFAQEHLAEPRAAGRCLAFNAEGNLDLKVGPTEGWDQVVSQLPPGWNPDLLLLQLAYTTVPAGLWSAPLPIVGMAGDYNLLWHYYRASLGRCDHVLTDVIGNAYGGAGMDHPTLRSTNIS
jgi:hypothetical protein